MVLFRKEMLAEQKSHSRVLDGVCVSDRKEMKREKMGGEGRRQQRGGRREREGLGAGRVVWAHHIQTEDPEGRDLTEITQQDSG